LMLPFLAKWLSYQQATTGAKDMPLKGITVRTVHALKPGETIWDGGHKQAVKGFGVRRQQGNPAYVIKYRVFGRQRFVTIGSHGAPWTPEQARKEARRLLGLVAAGKDPGIEKAEARLRAADTLGRIASDYLLHAKKKQKPRTFVETERHLLMNWRPLHSVSVFDVRRRQVAACLAEIEGDRGAVTAARARAALSAMFNWAIREGLDIAGNPVLGTNRAIEPESRERVLADGELAEIWRACRDDDYGRIVKLLALTAQRRDEVGGMCWAEVDLDQRLWTIPGLRTKNHREHALPLSGVAAAIIAESPARRKFVFGDGPRNKGGVERGFSGWSKSKAALDERILAARRERDPKAKPMADWRLHDLRRTAATVMADRLGVLPHVIEAVLNHVSGHRAGVAGVYNRAKYEADMRQALERWAEHIAAITGS
jgi:integrase